MEQNPEISSQNNDQGLNRQWLSPWMQAHWQAFQARTSRMLITRSGTGERSALLLRTIRQRYSLETPEPRSLAISRPEIYQPRSGRAEPSGWESLELYLPRPAAEPEPPEQTPSRPSFFGPSEKAPSGKAQFGTASTASPVSRFPSFPPFTPASAPDPAVINAAATNAAASDAAASHAAAPPRVENPEAPTIRPRPAVTRVKRGKIEEVRPAAKPGALPAPVPPADTTPPAGSAPAGSSPAGETPRPPLETVIRPEAAAGKLSESALTADRPVDRPATPQSPVGSARSESLSPPAASRTPLESAQGGPAVPAIKAETDASPADRALNLTVAATPLIENEPAGAVRPLNLETAAAAKREAAVDSPPKAGETVAGGLPLRPTAVEPASTAAPAENAAPFSEVMPEQPVSRPAAAAADRPVAGSGLLRLINRLFRRRAPAAPSGVQPGQAGRPAARTADGRPSAPAAPQARVTPAQGPPEDNQPVRAETPDTPERNLNLTVRPPESISLNRLEQAAAAPSQGAEIEPEAARPATEPLDLPLVAPAVPRRAESEPPVTDETSASGATDFPREPGGSDQSSDSGVYRAAAASSAPTGPGAAYFEHLAGSAGFGEAAAFPPIQPAALPSPADRESIDRTTGPAAGRTNSVTSGAPEGRLTGPGQATGTAATRNAGSFKGQPPVQPPSRRTGQPRTATSDQAPARRPDQYRPPTAAAPGDPAVPPSETESEFESTAGLPAANNGGETVYRFAAESGPRNDGSSLYQSPGPELPLISRTTGPISVNPPPREPHPARILQRAVGYETGAVDLSRTAAAAPAWNSLDLPVVATTSTAGQSGQAAGNAVSDGNAAGGRFFTAHQAAQTFVAPDFEIGDLAKAAADQDTPRSAQELKTLAREIFPYIKRLIMIERERRPNR